MQYALVPATPACAAHNASHVDDGTKMLVELTHVEKDIPDTRVLYWGSGAQASRAAINRAQRCPGRADAS